VGNYLGFPKEYNRICKKDNLKWAFLHLIAVDKHVQSQYTPAVNSDNRLLFSETPAQDLRPEGMA